MPKYTLNDWLDALRARGSKIVEKGRDQWMAQCPAHEDDTPSLSLWITDTGEVGHKCYAGCEWKAVKQALGLWDEPKGKGKGGKWPDRDPDVVFEYLKADGNPSFEMWRWNNPNGSLDTIRPVKPPFRGVEDSGYPKGSHVLYNLPEVKKCKELPVLVTEGEKSALAAQRLFPSCVVTTSAGGGNRSDKSDWRPLTGREVIIWPDADEPGIKYARKVRDMLLDLEASVKVVQVRGVGLPEKWDLADTVPAGVSLKDLCQQYIPDSELQELEAEELEAETEGKPVYSDTDATSLGNALDTLGMGIKFDTRNLATLFKMPNGHWDIAGGSIVRNEVREKALLPNGNSEGYRPFRFSDSDWQVATNALSYRYKFDPFLDLIESLQEPPDEDQFASATLLDDHFGVMYPEERPLAAWATRYVIIGMIQRAYEPGCQLDEMPILLGPQGTGKSSFLKAFFGPEHRHLFKEGLDLNSSPKSMVEAMQGASLVEISEMSGLTKARVEKTKSFVSRTDDGALRLSYRRDPVSSPRKCIFVGTGNHEDFQLPDDPSGQRRFIPITLGTPTKAIEPLMENLRDSLLAEGLARYKDGERANLPRALKKLAAQAAARYRHRNQFLEDGIINILSEVEGAKDGLSLRQIADMLGLTGQQRTSHDLPRSLKAIDWYELRTRKGGTQGRFWFPPADVEQTKLT